jgi:protein TonB
MFEDSTFESFGRIHTRSRAWMFATCVFNGSILLAMVLVPLIFPSALPRMSTFFPMAAPAPQTEEPKPVEHISTVKSVPSQIENGHITVPTKFPDKPLILTTPDVVRPITLATADLGADNAANVFSSKTNHPDVRKAASGPVRVSAPVVEGLLVRKVTPNYPPIAVTTRLEGTVVLQATISRTGAIENLRVMSGPMMLQQAALKAVQQWQYRPYLLNGEPVDVETTINVIFKLH